MVNRNKAVLFSFTLWVLRALTPFTGRENVRAVSEWLWVMEGKGAGR